MTVLVDMVDLVRRYDMGGEPVFALNGLSLQIEQGELVAIVGQSGSGKSTLMNLLGCLDTPTTGTYTLAGKNVAQLNDNELAEVRGTHIGFVFQSFHLLPRQTALENVTLSMTYNRTQPSSRATQLHRAAAALATVGLGDRAGHRPSELSGGQRQRVAIARALVHNPSILLADEPTGNLDSKTTEDILQLLLALHRDQKRTVIVVTHEPDIAARCDRVVHLKDGRMLSDTKR
jgi:putative ABC transport system ATP-binding protein